VLHAGAAVELQVLVDLRLPEYSLAMSAPTNSFMFEKPMTEL
jgi:hypothetical protein